MSEDNRTPAGSNPESPNPQTVLVDAIQNTLDNRIAPALAADGGWCEFVDFQDGVVYVRMLGACGTCPSAIFTLKAGIERILREEFPEVAAVEQVG